MILGLGIPELLIILVVILLIFGPKNLPKLGKSLGSTVKSIREGLEDGDEEEKPAKAVEAGDDDDYDEDIIEDEDDADIDEDAVADAGVFCTACGTKNPAGAAFCSKCGEKLV